MQTILFSEEKIGKLTLRNRLVVPPMCMWQAQDGKVNDFHLQHYAQLAGAGMAAVTIEATAVTPDGRISPWCLGIWDDDHAEGIAAMVKAMRKSDPEVKILLQLAHAGRKASCSPKTDCTVPPAEGGWQTVAPSALIPHQGVELPRALEEGEVGQYVQAFASAAARAVLAGVDGVMIHAAHGYLIHEFLSPLSNQRTDAYGGSFDKRLRFAVEVMAAVKQAVPADFPVGIRVSATDWLDGGWQLQDTLELLRRAEALGLSFADISTGGLLPCPIKVAPGYQLPFAAQAKQQLGLKILGVGLITNAFQAETALQLEVCDFVDIGRAVLSDPLFGWHAARDLGVELNQVPFSKSFACTR